jgi:hypothetical protein
VSTAATGAATPILPTAKARQSADSPIAPAMPARAAHPSAARAGAGSATSSARAESSTMPEACAATSTEKTCARREATPPVKSPAPQAAAAESASAALPGALIELRLPWTRSGSRRRLR